MNTMIYIYNPGPIDRYVYIAAEGCKEMNNSDSSMTTTDNPAKVVATQDLSEITIKGLAEKLSGQIDENRRLLVENHILWDLLLFDGLGVKMAR
jgi:hypothetical protein